MAAARGVGIRLRAARHARQLTLKEVAQATGLCVSTLSRLESGKRQASLALVVPLVDLYQISLDALIDEHPSERPRMSLPVVVQRRDSIVLPLTQAARGQRCSKMLLPATRCVPRLCQHEGTEWLCVLSGRLRPVVGDQDLLLEAGESAEFDTRLPHWFGTDGRGPVEILSMPGRQGRHRRVAAPASAPYASAPHSPSRTPADPQPEPVEGMST